MDYYNEFDEYPLQWLRDLQEAGHIHAGTFDGRSIVDVKAGDVKSARQAHFFAGIGGWPLALKLAGWPEDQEVWTGSCPCQPFSVAGSRKGTKDKRHLWPDFFRLIRECLPPVIFGEQVASKDGRAWLSGVRDDLESVGYEVGAADLCAASAGEEGEGWILRGDQVFVERIIIGAPHIRQRLFWVAKSKSFRYRPPGLEPIPGRRECSARQDGGDVARRLADAQHAERRTELQEDKDSYRGDGSGGGCNPCRVADGHKEGRGFVSQRNDGAGCDASGSDADRRREAGGMDNASSKRADVSAEAVEGCDRSNYRLPKPAGRWSRFDILPCSDKRSRRVESGTFPLAHGVPGRVGKLRAYGNAIVSELAAEFIKAFLETCSPT